MDKQTRRKATAARNRRTQKLTEPVTKADLYEFDNRLADRFTAIQGSLNGLHDRLTVHEGRHNAESREDVVEKEVKLDAKKAGLVGAIGAVIAAVVAGVTEVVRRS